MRGGGYPIDIRGTALEVVRRMHLLPQLQKAHVDTRRIAFLDADGGTVATIYRGRCQDHRLRTHHLRRPDPGHRTGQGPDYVTARALCGDLDTTTVQNLTGDCRLYQDRRRTTHPTTRAE